MVDECRACGGMLIDMSFKGRDFLVCSNCGNSVEVIDVECEDVVVKEVS